MFGIPMSGIIHPALPWWDGHEFSCSHVFYDVKVLFKVRSLCSHEMVVVFLQPAPEIAEVGVIICVCPVKPRADVCGVEISAEKAIGKLAFPVNNPDFCSDCNEP